MKIETLAVSDDGKLWLTRITDGEKTWYEVVNDKTVKFTDFNKATKFFLKLRKLK